ncbi:MAG TPA: TnsD family Tn7-like transposition protein [Burkholderiaceae bacterium]
MTIRSDFAQNLHREAYSHTLLTRSYGRPGEAAVPDETVFGMLSRHHVLTGHTSAKQTMTEIVKHRTISPSTSFPSHLHTIMTYLNLPESSVDDMIALHTVLPYFKPFVSVTTYRKVSHLIARGDAAAAKISLGILASRLGAQERLRFCPFCASEDLDRIGTPTWYRVHQLPGVHVCAYHGVPLQISERLVESLQRFQLFLPNATGHQTHAAVNIESNEQLDRLLLFARLSAQTLLAAPYNITNHSLRTLYAVHLMDRGLAVSSCRIRQRELFDQFMLYWSPLHSIDPFRQLLTTQGEASSWLASLCRKQRCSHHPLKHLLLIGLLIGDLPSLFHPISASTSHIYGQASHVKPPFDTIDEMLTTMIMQKGMSIHKAAIALHISTNTALVHAQRLKLPVARRPKKMSLGLFTKIQEALAKGTNVTEIASTLSLSESTINRILSSDPALQDRRAQNRYVIRDDIAKKNVLRLLACSPHAGFNDLRARLPADVAWLYRHDKLWLRENLAPIKTRSKPPPRVDWTARDAMLCKLIRRAAVKLRAHSGRPIRVSLSELCRQTGHGSWLEKKLEFLPNTRALLPTILESVEAFQQRRYWWWHEKQTGSTIYGEAEDWQIRRAAGVPKSFSPNRCPGKKCAS